MVDDLRYAVRLLLNAKRWTAVVVISLALGIGANTAIFGAVSAWYLRNLPVKDPGSLVRLRTLGRNQMANDSSDYGSAPPDVRSTFSYPMYKQFLADNQTMTDLIASAVGRVNLVVNDQADIATLLIVSGNFFQMLGVPAEIGRTLLPSDDSSSAPPVAVISARLWRSRFGSDPKVIGASVRVNNVPMTIVGVLPAAFTGIQQTVGELSDITVPVVLDSQLNTGPPRLERPTSWWVQVLGRLKPGVTPAQVEANLGAVFQQTARAGMDSYLASVTETERNASLNRNRKDVPKLIVDGGARGVYDVGPTDRRQLMVLSGVVIIVLLIVCANVANLLLARATARARELAIRLSLGASRRRLIRQLLTESLLLATMGGAAGIVVGYWAQQLLPGASGRAASIDWRLLAFALAITTTTGVVFGLLPALRATDVQLNGALKETGRGVVGSRTWLSNSLLIAQVAMSLVLLIGAGLFVRTLQNMRLVNVGFNPNNLLLFRINPQLNRYDQARVMSVYDQLEARLRVVPGVKTLAMSDPPMLSGGVSGTSIFVQGRQYGLDQRDNINRVLVSPSYFETLEIPLLAGRGILASDVQSAPKVAVINESAARKFFAGAALGHRFGSTPEQSSEIEVVGILRDIKYNSLREPAPPTEYIPYRQNSRVPSLSFQVRAALDPATLIPSVREVVRQVDPNVPLTNVSTQIEQIENRMLQERTFARASSLFGALASVLAAVGLFGLMSYSVSRRTNEIGVRMALGARAPMVLGLVMRESMWLVLGGVVVGVGLALALGRLIASQLFGVTSTDPTTIILSSLLMAVVGALAGYLPARRASRVDPMVALHYE